MNFSTVLALIAVSTFPGSHGVLASSDRAAESRTTTTTVLDTTSLSSTKTMEKPSHDAAMQMQPREPIGTDTQKMNAALATATATAAANTVTTITKSATCK